MSDAHTKAFKDKASKNNPERAFLRKCLTAYRLRLWFAWGLDVVAVLCFVALMWQIACFFGNLLQKTADAEYAFGQFLVAVAVLFGVRFLALLGRERILLEVGLNISHQVRQNVLQSLAVHGLARRQFGSDGALASHVLNEPDALMGYARFVVQQKTALSSALVILIAVASQSLKAALLLIVSVPFLLVLMAWVGIKTAKKSRSQMDALARLGGRFLDWIRGMNSLVRLGSVGIAKNDLSQAALAYQKGTMQVLRVAFLNSAVLELFTALSIAVVAIYLGSALLGLLPWSVAKPLIDYRLALFVLLLVPEFYAPLRRLSAEYHAKSSANAAAKVLAVLCATPKNQVVAPALVGDIVIKNLKVNQRLVLPDWHIKTGTRWALVGSSGAGKSTLFEVLLGVCAYEGSATMHAQQIAQLDQQSLYQHLGYLPQTPALLPISIKDNLKLAKTTATDQEIFAILEQVGLSFVHDLPDGINTKLGERGGGLSGGQMQRLAIAQLVLQDAPIWLLDEPTEHLDETTKCDIHALIERQSRGKTLIWATHDEPADWLDGVYRLKEHS